MKRVGSKTNSAAIAAMVKQGFNPSHLLLTGLSPDVHYSDCFVDCKHKLKKRPEGLHLVLRWHHTSHRHNGHTCSVFKK